MLGKLQKSNHSKDADLAALRAPPPPKSFAVSLRVRHDGSTWCLVQPTTPPPPPTEASEGGGARVPCSDVPGSLISLLFSSLSCSFLEVS